MKLMSLWLFVINLGIAFGAGPYEHRIVVSRWISTSASQVHWNTDAVREDDTGRRFWVFVTTIPLTLLTLANVVSAAAAAGSVRNWWLAAAAAALADRVLTFLFFIPTMVRLMGSPDSGVSRGRDAMVESQLSASRARAGGVVGIAENIRTVLPAALFSVSDLCGERDRRIGDLPVAHPKVGWC